MLKKEVLNIEKKASVSYEFEQQRDTATTSIDIKFLGDNFSIDIKFQYYF